MRSVRLRLNAHVLVLTATVLSSIPAAAADVALFIDDDFVDYTPNDDASEAWNLEQVLPALGHSVTAFDSIDSADLATALAGRDAFVLPELENDPAVGQELVGPSTFVDAIGTNGQAVIESFVDEGGCLIVFGGETAPMFDLLDTVFGIDLDVQVDRGGVGFLGTAANGTPFEGGPGNLGFLVDTEVIFSSTFPTDGLNIYEVNAQESIVAVFPYGTGAIIYLGWDWNQQFANGRGGTAQIIETWEEVLDRAVQYCRLINGGGASIVEVPTLNAWFSGLLVLSLAIAAALRFRQMA